MLFCLGCTQEKPIQGVTEVIPYPYVASKLECELIQEGDVVQINVITSPLLSETNLPSSVESIPEIEEAILGYGKNASGSNDSSLSDVLVIVHYCVDGISDFRITSNKEIFDIPSGQSLNQHFSIKEFYPKYVFSYADYSIVLDSSNPNLPISDWLQVSPMVQPCMSVVLKETLEEPIDNLTFTISMTLTNGEELTATTPMKE
jgi:hypothetical protein